jgi:hypothetical protein
VNCGGEAHTDSYGIQYLRDMSKVGTSSDYGKQLLIGRVPQKDQILYQTERYHTSTFGYDIPITEDGRYLLVLKFSEVYFNAPNMKVSFLDIFIWLYLNNKFSRERGMASTPKIKYQVFLCIFQNISAMATLVLTEMEKSL